MAHRLAAWCDDNGWFAAAVHPVRKTLTKESVRKLHGKSIISELKEAVEIVSEVLKNA